VRRPRTVTEVPMTYLILGGLLFMIIAFLVMISVQLLRIEKKIVVLTEVSEAKVMGIFSNA
jgi:hypothetical protein